MKPAENIFLIILNISFAFYFFFFHGGGVIWAGLVSSPEGGFEVIDPGVMKEGQAGPVWYNPTSYHHGVKGPSGTGYCLTHATWPRP